MFYKFPNALSLCCYQNFCKKWPVTDKFGVYPLSFFVVVFVIVDIFFFFIVVVVVVFVCLFYTEQDTWNGRTLRAAGKLGERLQTNTSGASLDLVKWDGKILEKPQQITHL